MGDTNMDKVDDLVDYNEVDPITGTVSSVPNKGIQFVELWETK